MCPVRLDGSVGGGVVSANVSCKQGVLLHVIQLFQQFQVIKDSMEIVQLSKVWI